MAVLAACDRAAPPPPAASAPATAPQTAVAEIIRTVIPGPSLDGDMAGDETPLEALVYLPPGYARDPEKRFPLLVLLHGYWSAPGQWEDDYLSIVSLYADALAAGKAREMIVVMPTGADRLGGGFYVNGAASGDWEDYIAEDVVAFADRSYRTLASRESRGVAGHSMGGYGALSIAASRPDVFSAVYAMSPCCGDLVGDFATDAPHWGAADALDTAEEFEAAEDFFARVLVALGAAWAPDASAPLMSQRPVKDGVIDDAMTERWRKNTLIRRVASGAENLQRHTAIGLDVGDRDEFSHILQSTPAISAQMTALGIDHDFEIYPGDHVSGVAARLRDEVLPFFSAHLIAE